MTQKVKMHFAYGLPDYAICGADIRRGGFTSDDKSVTCLRCLKLREAKKAPKEARTNA